MSLQEQNITKPVETPENAEAWQVKSSAILSVKDLAELNLRSDGKGWQQLFGHLVAIGVSGTIWGVSWGQWWVAIPALAVYGFSLASMFTCMHECIHRTAFASQRLNDWVAWLAGVLSFNNSTFYRRFHKWHHRYTKIPGKDPELDIIRPTNNWFTYIWRLSSIPWWRARVSGHFRAALGKFEGCPYISETSRREVMQSTWWQLAVYGLAIALSIAVWQPWFVTYWLLPLAVGQPILRFIQIAEHTGCPKSDNPLVNTRTTLTIWPIQFFMWNMTFHAEHHLYASIPFHALPKAHEKLAPHLVNVAQGCVAANRQIVNLFDMAVLN